MEKYDSEAETRKHIKMVSDCLGVAIRELTLRQEQHDATKLESPEFEIYEEWTPKLAGCEYGSTEYRDMLSKMKPALDHHYGNNRHHPEHWPNGVVGMNLIDLVEMLCDWMSAAKRHATGDVRKSIEINQKRFGYSDEIKQILLNTVSGWEAA